MNADAWFGQTSTHTRRSVVINGREVVDGEVLVRYRPHAGPVQRERAEFQAASDRSEPIGRRGTARLRSRTMGTQQLIETLRANPDVELVEPNYVIHAASTPNDPSFGNLWGLFNSGQVVDNVTGVPGADINARTAWDVTTGSRANVVAVLDTGIDYTHPDLVPNMFSAPREFTVQMGTLTVLCGAGTHGYDAINNTCQPYDSNGHGTHVAGIIGAAGNNNVGVTGVNWRASVMALRVLGTDGTGTTTDAIEAIEFAIKAKVALGNDANIRVLNASWWGSTFSQALDDEINAAGNYDMLFVAAAGAGGTNNDSLPFYPASSSRANVIAVAATDAAGHLAANSNYGATSVDLGAPGGSTLSTLPNNDYGYMAGTSMAAAHVAGAAALTLAACPTANTAALRSALITAVRADSTLAGKTASGGRLDVNAAIAQCLSAPSTSITVNGTSGAVTVAPGATMSVSVTNGGTANTWDYVMVAPTGAASTYWSGVYQFLNGTTTQPSAPITSATINVVAPTTPGTYEVRFNAAGGYGRLATSGVITVGSTTTPPPPPPPPPSSTSTITVNGTSGALTVAPGATMSVAVTNGGTADTWDYVMVAPSGAATSYWSGVYQFLNGTTTRPSAPITSATINVVAPTTPGTYEVRFNSAGGYTRLATSGVITVSSSATPPPPPPPPPSATATMTVNGTAGAVTVAPGATMSVVVSNPGTANVWDYVMVAPSGAATSYWSGVYQFLNGTTTLPSAPITNATVNVVAPTTPGTYEVRFNAAGGYSRLATSGVITVSSSATPPPPPPSATATMTVNGNAGALTVAPGATMSVVVNNPGTANTWDYVMVAPVGAASNYWSGVYQFLNGTTTLPSAPITNATINVVAPTTPGTYEVRFNSAGGYTRLATSGVITVSSSTPPPPPPPPPSSAASVTVNGTAGALTVAPGATMSVAVTNGGTANTWDYVMVAPVGAVTNYWSGVYQFLNGTTTLPSAPMTSATISVVAPTTPGTYEVRFNSAGGYTRLATSGVITVSATTAPAPAPSGTTSITVNGTAGALTVAAGSMMSVAVSNSGTADVWDYVMVAPAGSASTYWSGVYQLMNGTTTLPSSPISSATISVRAPTTPGTYEVRFNAAGGYTRLATSGVITVQ